MTLIQFIRLLKNHSLFLLVTPVVLAATIFILTMNQPKEYKSTTVVYTALTSGQGLNGSDSRVDLSAVNSSFDNLLGLITSRQTLERTGLRLLAQQLSRVGPNGTDLDDATYQHILKLLPADVRMRFTVFGSPDSTYEKLVKMKDHPRIADVLTTDSEPYAPEYIEKHLKVKRNGVSDMLEISYTSISPSTTQATLVILNDIFLGDFRLLKIQQAGTMVKFFEGEVEKSAARLKRISEELKSFRTLNRIINYDEQTKQVTVQDVYIETEYRDELRKLSAAEAALAELNAKIGIRSAQLSTNRVVVETSGRLADVSRQLAVTEATTSDSLAVAKLKNEAAQLRQELRSSVGHLYETEYTREGISSKALVDQWLAQFLNVAEQKARVDLMRERQQSFQKRFDQFAPLGSTLHNYEREIDVIEREYLELLHSLNVARLYQQNLEATSNIRIVDAPNVPRTAEPSKRFLLVIVGWIAGLFLCVTAVVSLEYLDRSLRTPHRAELLTQLTVAGALPDLRFASLPSVASGLRLGIEQLVRVIKLSLHLKPPARRPNVIALCSVNRQEGKSLVAQHLVDRLTELGHKVAALIPEHNIEATRDARSAKLFEYAVPTNFYDVESVTQLSPNPEELNRLDFVILELPSLLHSPTPLRLLQQVDLTFVVVRSDRVWGKAEANALQVFSKIGRPMPDLILSGVKDERMEDLVGELPKQRSRFRKFVKRTARLEFNS